MIMDTIYFTPPRRGLPGLLLLLTTHGPVYRWLPVVPRSAPKPHHPRPIGALNAACQGGRKAA